MGKIRNCMHCGKPNAENYVCNNQNDKKWCLCDECAKIQELGRNFYLKQDGKCKDCGKKVENIFLHIRNKNKSGLCGDCWLESVTKDIGENIKKYKLEIKKEK